MLAGPLEELSWTSDGTGWRGAATALGVESCVGHERTATAPRAGGELRRHQSEGGCALAEEDEGAGSPEGKRQKSSSSRSAVMLAKKNTQSLAWCRARARLISVKLEALINVRWTADLEDGLRSRPTTGDGEARGSMWTRAPWERHVCPKRLESRGYQLQNNLPPMPGQQDGGSVEEKLKPLRAGCPGACPHVWQPV